MIEEASSPGKSALLDRAATVFGQQADARTYARSELALAFVAIDSTDIDGNDIVGWCWGYLLPRPDGAAMAYLHELEVPAGHRRRGTGRQLVRSFLRAAEQRGATKVFLTTGEANAPARALYEALGGTLATQGPTVSYWFALDPPSGACAR